MIKCNNLNSKFYSLDSENTIDIHTNSSFKTDQNTTQPKAMLVINPQTPTGKVLSPEEMQKIIKYCYDNSLVLIASEVLQDQCYSDDFKSFRSQVNLMHSPYNQQELFSFYSISKSPLFEGSSRTGYLNILNLDEDVKRELYKHISMDICTSIPGQIILDLITQIKLSNKNDIFHMDLKLDLETSQKILREKFFDQIENLNKNYTKSSLFKFIEKPQAGHSIFIQLNLEVFEKNKRSFISGDRENLNLTNCELYSKALYDMTGVLVTPGIEYGNFPDHIVINFCNEYLANAQVKHVLEFNNYVTGTSETRRVIN